MVRAGARRRNLREVAYSDALRYPRLDGPVHAPARLGCEAPPVPLGMLPPAIPRFQSNGGSPAGRRDAPDRHRCANVISCGRSKERARATPRLSSCCWNRALRIPHPQVGRRARLRHRSPRVASSPRPLRFGAPRRSLCAGPNRGGYNLLKRYLFGMGAGDLPAAVDPAEFVAVGRRLRCKGRRRSRRGGAGAAALGCPPAALWVSRLGV